LGRITNVSTKLLILALFACAMSFSYGVGKHASSTVWLNSAQKSSCTNPFFTKGFTVFIDGQGYELGFRDDGIMVWKHPATPAR
jgi:hypothetical protein